MDLAAVTADMVATATVVMATVGTEAATAAIRLAGELEIWPTTAAIRSIPIRITPAVRVVTTIRNLCRWLRAAAPNDPQGFDLALERFKVGDYAAH